MKHSQVRFYHYIFPHIYEMIFEGLLSLNFYNKHQRLTRSFEVIYSHSKPLPKIDILVSAGDLDYSLLTLRHMFIRKECELWLNIQ